MRMLLYVFAFVGTGLLVGLIFRRYQPAAAPPSVWISTLVGVIGSLITGLVTLMVLGHGRSTLYDYGYDRVPGPEGAALPAYWISLFTAPLGALIALIINRLLRARQLRS